MIGLLVSNLGIAQERPIEMFFRNGLKGKDSVTVALEEAKAKDTLVAGFKEESGNGNHLVADVETVVDSKILRFAQKTQNQNKRLAGYLGTGVGGTDSDYTPFWVRANQYGVVPNSGTYSTTNLAIHSTYKSDKETDIAVGLSTWLNTSTTETEVLVQEAYVAAKWRAWEIFAGRKKQVFGLTDSLISSGSYAWSQNALPLTKIEVGTRGFYYPKLLGGLVAVNMSYGHGFFNNDRVDVHDFYLHQKQLYVKLGRKTSPIRLVGGFNHQVQWGGTLQFEDSTNTSGINGKVAKDFSSYVSAVIGRLSQGDTINYGRNDAFNRYGNHLGTVDVGFEFENKVVKVLGYRQSIYEDGSLYFLGNLTDGLNGISFEFKQSEVFKRAIFEYFRSTSQGGFGGRNLTGDNYFNNEVYREGWSNRQTGIGTPFITHLDETDIRNVYKAIPYFDNNRVRVFYAALYLKVNAVDIILRGSIGTSYGNYRAELGTPLIQNSLGVSVKAPLNLFGVSGIFQTRLGYDSIGWYNTPNMGGVVSLAIPLF